MFFLIVQRKEITTFPQHIHAWAHVDHYSMSRGFIENDFDFFHPQTYTKDKEFQSPKHPNRQSRITSSDFPLVQYSSAVLMKITGTESPVIYRLWMLVISCIGLLFLFKISYFLSSNLWPSLLLPLCLITSPVYLDFQIGFIPTSAAISLFFIGSYYVIVYLYQGSRKKLLIGVMWLSLSAAIRTPLVIPLMGIIGFLAIRILGTKRDFKGLAIALLGLLLPIIYYIYNIQLRDEYGSIFLGTPRPADNWMEFKSNLSIALTNWKFHYFGKWQWFLILTGIAISLAISFLKTSKNKLIRSIFAWLAITLAGEIMYIILMSKQLIDHDYYLLDTIIPTSVILALTSWSIFLNNKEFKLVYFTGLLLVFYSQLSDNINVLDERRSVERNQVYNDMFNSYSHLDDILQYNNINFDQDILFLEPFAPNMSFALSHCKGSTMMHLNSDKLHSIKNRSEEFIIVRDDVFYKEVIYTYPEIIEITNLIDYKNGLFILKRTAIPNDGNLFQWLKIEPSLSKQTITTCQSKQVSDCIFMEDSTKIITEFGLNWNDTIASKDEIKLCVLKGFFSKSNESEAVWHVLITNKNGDIYNEYIQITTTETLILKEIILPQDKEDISVVAYLYNPNFNTIHFKDVEIIYY